MAHSTKHLIFVIKRHDLASWPGKKARIYDNGKWNIKTRQYNKEISRRKNLFCILKSL